MVYILMICMVVPLLLLIPMLEKQSRLLLGFVLGGMVLAVCAYEINSFVCALFSLSGPELSITAMTGRTGSRSEFWRTAFIFVTRAFPMIPSVIPVPW